MATPDVYGQSEVPPFLPTDFKSRIKKGEWQGRAVKQLDIALRELPQLLSSVASRPQAETLSQALGYLKNPQIKLKAKIALLASQNLQVQIHFARLQTIPQCEKITSKVVQIPVLDQHADGTGGAGFENCGYHALKNGLAALATPGETQTVAELFQNQSLFLEFYQTYCQPPEEKSSGKRDATTPVLHQIISRFIADPAPPPDLIPLQQVLTAARAAENLVLLNVASTDSGMPLLGFFDERGLVEAHKLHQFLTSPGPNQLALVLGDETMGHWVTLIAFKNTDGKLSFMGCDSADNHQSTLRANSPLHKLATLIEELGEHPNALLMQAYVPVGEELERMAAGSMAEESFARFLDDIPYPLLATPEAPNGSQKERLVAKCLHAYAYLQAAGWLSSHNYEAQLHVAHLETVIHALTVNLPPDDPQLEKLRPLLQALQLRPKGRVEATFDLALQEIEALKGAVTPTALERSLNTFKWMKKIYLQRNEIAAANDDTARNSKINQLTGGGAEAGFSAGKTSAEAEKTLKRRVDLLLLTYQRAKERGLLKEMVVRLGQGDPCLTARMGAVEAFAAQLAGFGEIDDSQAEKVALLPVTALAATLELLLEDFEESETDSFLEAFQVEDLRPSPARDLLIEQFKIFAKAETAKPFLQFLLTKGLIEDVNQINWEEIINNLLALPEINTWLSKAKSTVV